MEEELKAKPKHARTYALCLGPEGSSPALLFGESPRNDPRSILVPLGMVKKEVLSVCLYWLWKRPFSAFLIVSAALGFGRGLRFDVSIRSDLSTARGHSGKQRVPRDGERMILCFLAKRAEMVGSYSRVARGCNWSIGGWPMGYF